MLPHAVDDPVRFEIHGKTRVIPTADGRLADSRVLLVRLTEALLDAVLRFALLGQWLSGSALLANRYAQSIGQTGQGQKQGKQEKKAGHAKVSWLFGEFAGLTTGQGLLLQDMPGQ